MAWAGNKIDLTNHILKSLDDRCSHVNAWIRLGVSINMCPQDSLQNYN